MDKTKIAVEIFDKFAKQYQDKFMYVDLYNESFDFFCSRVEKENAEILELACGPGNITQYLLKQRPDFKIMGTDLAVNMLELAKVNNPTAEFKLMDCRDIDTIEKKYDAIMCGFCLPYLPKEDAEKLITDASALLNTGGVFYISTMEDDYSKSGLKTSSAGNQMYMHYHQSDYLIAALERNDFDVIYFKQQPYPEQDGTITTDLLLIAKRQ